MFNFGKVLVVSLFVSILCLSTNVFAAGQFYLNAAVGQSDIDSVLGIGFDEGTSFSLGTGYLFSDNFGIEASYIDFGDMEDDIIGIVELSGDAILLMGVARYNMTEMFSIYAKAGLAMWDVEASALGESASEDGTDLTWALGLMLSFNENFSVYGQYQMFEFESEGEELDLDNMALGLQYHF